MEKENIVKEIKKRFPENIREVSSQFGDDIVVFEKEALLEVVKFLKEKPFEFTLLLDLTCVDFLKNNMRFEMVYHLLSISNSQRIRLKTRLPEKNPNIDSLTPLWKNANWLEREVYDMFGIHFNGHPYLTRIFMYEGFEGHPLRKDYPLRKRQPRIRMRK